jgi:aminoglycoside phosphotransferase (APT) family kinase protein
LARADTANLLAQLSATVKERLAPAASDPFLASELYSLASLLRILAEENAALKVAADEERAELLALIAVDEDSSDTLRSRLAASVRGGDSAARLKARRFVRGDLSRGYIGLIAPGTSPGRVVAVEGGLHDDPKERRSRLAQFLSEHIDGWTIAGWSRATGGYGSETLIGEVADRNGLMRKLAVRIQLPDFDPAGLQQDVTVQAEAMTAARVGGLPVPQVLAAVADPSLIGAPFLISEFIAGVTPVTWTRAGQGFTERLARENPGHVAAALADLHAARVPSALDDGSPDRTTRVDQLSKIYRERGEIRPDPLIEEVLLMLRETPTRTGGGVIVHGDFRPGNMIYGQDCTLRAVIDWDGTHIGDHHFDLGHTIAWPFRDDRGRVAGLLSEPQFIEAYESAGGATVIPSTLEYYRLMSAFRRYLVFALLARRWLDHGGDVKLARAWLALRRDRIELGKLIGVDIASAP